MQTTETRLHPLLTIAAISVTVLSAVGVASLTGMIPASKGQDNALELPKEVTKPLEPAISHPVTKPAPNKIVARRPAPKPVEPVAAPAPVATPAPVLTQAPVLEAPKPQPLPGQLAIVESVREVKEPGDAKGIGAVAGGVLGGVLGNKLGKGKGLVTVLGAAGGAVAGHQIEKHARADKRWETAVRLDDGSQQTVSSDAQPAWNAGDRVRLLDGKLLPI